MSGLQGKLSCFDIDVEVVPGHDLIALREILSSPRRRPKFIVLESTKGKGVSFMENRMEWHYLPLTDELYKNAVQDIQMS